MNKETYEKVREKVEAMVPEAQVMLLAVLGDLGIGERLSDTEYSKHVTADVVKLADDLYDGLLGDLGVVA